MSAAEPLLLHHFDDLEQQHNASVLGMWAFLATEVMFFGGVIGIYAVYRYQFPAEFAYGSHHLRMWLGAANTAVLLASSLTMALAVRSAQLENRARSVSYLLLTGAIGAMFLGIKAFEYYQEYRENLIPFVRFETPDLAADLSPRAVELFFVLYFFATWLHAFHLLVGIALVTLMAVLVHRGWVSGAGVVQVEVTGLYWHFVDIVWVFLYPLLYLIEA